MNILSIDSKTTGNHKAVCPTVPHCIQAMENPLKANATEPNRDGKMDNFKFLKYRKRNPPAKRGCRNIRKDHATENGNMKKKILRG